jgi:Protein of unknown function (DUF732)
MNPASDRPKPAPRYRLVACAVAAGALVMAFCVAPRASGAPAPEVEYLYDVTVRRHYSFPNNDALGYGHGICDKVNRGDSYAQVMGDTKRDVGPGDEFAANYLVSYAVNLLCPALIWQLRNSAANYLPPPAGG